jgi:CRP-like cAMP-binding protein
MSSHPIGRNLLLERLPQAERDRLSSHLRSVNLEFKQVLYRYHDPIEFVYFPISGAVSAVTLMEDGRAIEVATIGNEGMIGHSVLFQGGEAPNEVIVQVPGEALRMSAALFGREAEHDGPLKQLMLRYNTAYFTQVSQSVACNGLHNVLQRCCRWLLITHDRMESNVVPLTHEFLAVMLGVRRASVTDVLHPLSEQGLIDNNNRGAIEILDRPKLEKLTCECYHKVRSEYDRLLSNNVG